MTESSEARQQHGFEDQSYTATPLTENIETVGYNAENIKESSDAAIVAVSTPILAIAQLSVAEASREFSNLIMEMEELERAAKIVYGMIDDLVAAKPFLGEALKEWKFDKAFPRILNGLCGRENDVSGDLCRRDVNPLGAQIKKKPRTPAQKAKLKMKISELRKKKRLAKEEQNRMMAEQRILAAEENRTEGGPGPCTSPHEEISNNSQLFVPSMQF